MDYPLFNTSPRERKSPDQFKENASGRKVFVFQIHLFWSFPAQIFVAQDKHQGASSVPQTVNDVWKQGHHTLISVFSVKKAVH
ncbi:hypothetical protein ACOMHN_044052 [Nucella lapillus]